MTVLGKCRSRIRIAWRLFWVKRSHRRGFGALAARLASIGTLPRHSRAFLSHMSPGGFAAPGAALDHPQLECGEYVYIGDGVSIHRAHEGGPAVLGDRVQLYGDSFIRTGAGARLEIGDDTHVQPGCYINAAVSDIRIGSRVEIAATCAIYSFNHGMAPGPPIMDQPLVSDGPVVIGDGAWLGHGVTVLQNVAIGPGAVVGAGSVVVRDIPANAIAAGVPAKVIGSRESG